MARTTVAVRTVWLSSRTPVTLRPLRLSPVTHLC